MVTHVAGVPLKDFRKQNKPKGNKTILNKKYFFTVTNLRIYSTL